MILVSSARLAKHNSGQLRNSVIFIVIYYYYYIIKRHYINRTWRMTPSPLAAEYRHSDRIFGPNMFIKYTCWNKWLHCLAYTKYGGLEKQWRFYWTQSRLNLVQRFEVRAKLLGATTATPMKRSLKKRLRVLWTFFALLLIKSPSYLITGKLSWVKTEERGPRPRSET